MIKYNNMDLYKTNNFGKHKFFEYVKADRIIGIMLKGNICTITTELGEIIDVGKNYIEKCKPHIGGYFVVFANCAYSFYSADDFKTSGYEVDFDDGAHKKFNDWMNIETFTQNSKQNDDTVDEMTVEKIAKVCYEVIRSYCQVLDDDTRDGWDDISQEKRDSFINGVDFYLSGKYGVISGHENWCIRKRKDGWTYGPVKCEQLKTHPSLIGPFYKLNLAQQVKYDIFRTIVHSMRDVRRAL